MIFTMLALVGGSIYVGVRALERWLETSSPPRAALSDGAPCNHEQSDAPEGEDPEREINHYLAVSSVNLTVAAAGALLFSPLTLLSIPLTIYAFVPLFKQAYHALAQEQRLRAVVLDAVAIVGTFLAGFFVASALTSTLFFVSRKLLSRTEDRSRRKLVNIFGTQIQTVWIEKGGVELEIPFSDLQVGDVVIVNAGQLVPADGKVRKGAATVDEKVLSGEARPVEKSAGEQVFAATLILSGRIHVEIEKAGAETVAAQIGAILNQTADYRAQVASLGERLGDRLVLPILALGALGGVTVGTEGAIAILFSNFTDSMRIAVPLGMLNFLSEATQHGILIKDGRALELIHEVDTVVFDKTGTLTMEQPQLGDIHACQGNRAETLLTYAAAAEVRQSHPVARAICEAAAQRGLQLPPLDQSRYQVGYGIDAEIAGRRIRVGSARFMGAEGIAVPEPIQQVQARANMQGVSLIYVAIDDELGGVLELRPMPRPEVRQVIEALKGRGLSLYIISGDHEAPTRALAAEVGIEHYFAEVLPEAKAALVERLQLEGHKVCFVGDGINDSIALKRAKVSVSLRGATTLATDTAQVVLMDGNLRHLPRLFSIAGDFQANTRTTALTTFVPMAFSIGGVFFLGFGLLTSIILFNLSLLASVANAMRPTLKEAPPCS
jgi:Cu2+-exporting ATPase